ncbi:MAG: hypothetical protein KJ950_10105 [Proteobacteria bacterium]|nr:hypothetical protein [Pseudomonadota bacterium]MBU1687729.1 hypothetical protein [Pseudomonadota bacterium]
MSRALSTDTQPHFTTSSNFISNMDAATIRLFRDVLLYCDQMDLVGKEMFAMDGCKLSSNASKERSGTADHGYAPRNNTLKHVIKYGIMY